MMTNWPRGRYELASQDPSDEGGYRDRSRDTIEKQIFLRQQCSAQLQYSQLSLIPRTKSSLPPPLIWNYQQSWVVHKLRYQDEVGTGSLKCQLYAYFSYIIKGIPSPMSTGGGGKKVVNKGHNLANVVFERPLIRLSTIVMYHDVTLCTTIYVYKC